MRTTCGRRIAAATLFLGASLACAQDYPTRPIRLISPGPGGGADFVARLLSHGISGPLGQQIVVDNRPAGVIPGQIVSKAPPDGYTIMVNGNSFWLSPLMRSSAPYDPLKDFSPISTVVASPNILVVHSSVSANNVKELIALAKAKPGFLNYASSTTGGSGHLSAELFKYLAGVDLVRVSYKTSGTSVNSLIAGEVHVMFGNAPPVVPHVKAGRLKALAVTTLQRSVLFPDLPTIAESGLPGFDTASVYGLFAPANTPAPIVGRLNQEVVRLLGRPEAKDKLLATGVVAVGSTPRELSAAMQSEIERMGPVIRSAGIRED